jgi:hypothetical protein
MNIRYLVTLNEDERALLAALASGGKVAAQMRSGSTAGHDAVASSCNDTISRLNCEITTSPAAKRAGTSSSPPIASMYERSVPMSMSACFSIGADDRLAVPSRQRGTGGLQHQDGVGANQHAHFHAPGAPVN